MPAVETGRTGPLPRTAWTDRVRAVANASGVTLPGLGELVEQEIAQSDRTLFTVTPAEELDAISRWQRLADTAWCGQVREIVAAHNRLTASDREFFSCELALALNLSDGAAQDIVATALLAADAPGLVEAVEAGLLTVRHVHAVLKELNGCGLSTEEQHAVVTVALVRYAGQTPAELGKLVARLILTVHPAAAAAKEADATYRRRVRCRAVQDGQGILVARGPLWAIEQMRAALAAQAAATGRYDARGEDGGAGRTRDAIEFDLLHDLILSGARGQGSAAGSGGGWVSAIVMSHQIAQDADTGVEEPDQPPTEPASEPDADLACTAATGAELAEIPGLGLVLPQTARQILARSQGVQRIVVDEHGQVIDVSPLQPGPAACADVGQEWLRNLERLPLHGTPAPSSGYRPSPRLDRYVRARERTCCFPGCSRPAVGCDLDHRLAYPEGPTDANNLQPLCRRHHRAKQAVFLVLHLPDGTTRWITRGGWWFDRPPQRYLDPPDG